MVALVLGKVIVVESVPSSVKLLFTVRVLPSRMVRVLPVAGAVMVTLLMLVAEATPRTGVVRVGLVAKTKRPEPVSSVTAAARLALEGVARKVATFAPKPDTPVEMGSPVQLVNVPEAGVPRTGATRVSVVPSVVAPVMPPKAPALLYWTWVFEPPGDAEAVAHERTPEPSVWRNWEGVPSSTGRVRVYEAEATPDLMVVVLALVAFLSTIAPAVVEAVPSVRAFAAVKVIEAKVGVELVAMLWGKERTTVLPAPLSVMVIWFAVPVSTRSLVRAALAVSVT
jgi:hypothetical protein